MGTIILIVYLVGWVLTWIASVGIMYKQAHDNTDQFGVVDLERPIESILFSGFMGFCFAMFWPLVLACFGVYRIATRNLPTRENSNGN